MVTNIENFLDEVNAILPNQIKIFGNIGQIMFLKFVLFILTMKL